MDYEWVTVFCSDNFAGTKRDKPFEYLKVRFDLKSNLDQAEQLRELYRQATSLATQVNANFANSASETRDSERLIRDSFAGLLAEYSWMTAINDLVEMQCVSQTEYESGRDQVDLITSRGSTIEVRSSYPRNGIDFALCSANYQFDVIGPYVNAYKSSESVKDFYVRTLFPFDAKDIFGQLRSGLLEFGLTGGATRAMFNNATLYKEKTLRPEDFHGPAMKAGETSYRVIPFAQALDTRDVLNAIESN